MKPIRRRREVISDLTEIYVWIGADNVDAADRFLAAVDKTFEDIRKNPGLGWARPWKNHKLNGMRSWRVHDFPNLLVFYREEKSAIEIYGVISGYRHLERALHKRRSGSF